jgi:hypothetical protein
MKKLLFIILMTLPFIGIGQQVSDLDLEKNTFKISIGKIEKKGKIIIPNYINFDKNTIETILNKIYNHNLTMINPFNNKKKIKKITNINVKFIECQKLKNLMNDGEVEDCYFEVQTILKYKRGGTESTIVPFGDNLKMGAGSWSVSY